MAEDYFIKTGERSRMSCQVVIDTPAPFSAGFHIQGKLVCNFIYRQRVRCIKIRASCKEHTQWWGTERLYDLIQKRHMTKSILYTGNDKVFSLEYILLRGNNADLYLGPGVYTYPFSVQLPSDLPSSFENDHGHIRYFLKGIVDISSAVNYKDKVHFRVFSPINLNLLPLECFQPVSNSDRKTTSGWCRKKEITANIKIAKMAYIPGEKVKLYVALTNMSNSNIDGLQTKLVQNITSHIRLPCHLSKVAKNTLASNTSSGVGANGENKYDIEISIPSNATLPNFSRSSLFEVNYDIQITAHIPGSHSDIDLVFSVNMGHIQHESQVSGASSGCSLLQGEKEYSPSAPRLSSISSDFPSTTKDPSSYSSQLSAAHENSYPPSYQDVLKKY